VATSLDGHIAGPNGEADWIVVDPGASGAPLNQEGLVPCLRQEPD